MVTIAANVDVSKVKVKEDVSRVLFDQDFGYECIGQSSSPMAAGAPQHLQQIPAQFQDDILDHASPQIAVAAPEEDSIAEQYRGTPPMKSKKKKPDRRSQSHEVSENVSCRPW